MIPRVPADIYTVTSVEQRIGPTRDSARLVLSNHAGTVELEFSDDSAPNIPPRYCPPMAFSNITRVIGAKLSDIIHNEHTNQLRGITFPTSHSWDIYFANGEYIKGFTDFKMTSTTKEVESNV